MRAGIGTLSAQKTFLSKSSRSHSSQKNSTRFVTSLKEQAHALAREGRAVSHTRNGESRYVCSCTYKLHNKLLVHI